MIVIAGVGFMLFSTDGTFLDILISAEIILLKSMKSQVSAVENPVIRLF